MWKLIVVYVVLLLSASFVFEFHWITSLLGLLILVFCVAASRSHFFGDVLFMVFQIVLWSLLLTHLYNHEYTRNENQTIQELAIALADERDPDFESSYLKFLNVAQHDTTFFSTVLSDDIMEEVAEDYMRNFMFDSLMNQYTVKLTLCQPGVELEVPSLGLVSDCMGFFQDKVGKNHGIDLGEGLCFLDYNTLDPSYLAMINILVNDSVTDCNLFLEFSKPVAPPSFGLSRLLKETTGLVPVNSSVACYQDSILVYKYGSYVYPNYLSDYQHQINGFSYGRLLKHYAYQADSSKVIAISVNRRGWMDTTVPFTFFFFFLLILYLLIYFLGGLNHKHSFSGTLSNKFQMIVLVALGISFLLVGPVSAFYMRGIYNQKASDFHFERTRSLQQDLTSGVDFSILKQPSSHYELDRILWHYSAMFYTDINLYGLDGKLLSTTCPELQELHLQASLMNAEAFHNMQGERTLYFIQTEHLGNASYQSAYMAILDDSGKTMAYLNTPYFSSKSGLRDEIVNFILTYINIILLIILFFLPLILLLTHSVTGPLVQLQEKMQQIDINRSNELLEWKSNDEIGALVSQYNQLVVELEKSAAELRRTTAESAWRGVARQVAHEIKNSLTPMRLSVQLLQRSMENGAPDLDDRVRRTSATLIEQIDALSDIASSFSSYAKLPESHPQLLDLAELIGNLVNLYDNAENISFSYNYDPSKDHTFNGDKTHLNSAIGNIIKNATQAIGLKPDGRIEVTLQSTKSAYTISIKDNGKGIKEEDKKMIFLPNFTTKSGGSGVGLSLAYNIIQAARGTITFESQEGEGTEFVIKLPK
ncbi:MAG: HAMP domain-containing histidine kinase [Bacteroidales bacterium]|nr:HAMP domain-containing histidine kinase [Bacteroidales bacterium]